MTLADIERIAPLEEGMLPFNLAEAQRQVSDFSPGAFHRDTQAPSTSIPLLASVSDLTIF